MKTLVVVALALMSFSALANGRSAREVIAGIEEREGVSCVKVDESRFKVCIGAGEAATCRWKETYECRGESDLTVKLSMKSEIDNDGYRVSFVTKTSVVR